MASRYAGLIDIKLRNMLKPLKNIDRKESRC